MKSRFPNKGISALFLSTALIIGVTVPVQGQTTESYVPALQASDGADLGLALVNPTLAEAKVTLTARSYQGAVIQSDGVTNPVTLTLPASGQIALLAAEIFGTGISGQAGWVQISASTPAVKGFFLAFDSGLSFIDGAEFATPAKRLIFPKVSTAGSSPTQLSLVNTATRDIQASISLYSNDGTLFANTSITVPALSGFRSSIDELVPSAIGFEGYAVMDTELSADSGMPESLIGFETYRNRSDIALIRAFPESARLRTGFLAHLASQGGYFTRLTLVNFSNDPQVLRITADGLHVGGSPRTPSSVTVERTLPPNARLEEPVDQMFNLSGDALIDGYIRFETETNTSGVIGFLDYGTTDGMVLSAVEAQGEGYSNLFFSQVAEGAAYYTGLALLNPNNEPSIVTLDIFDAGGNRTGSTIVNLDSGERKAGLLSELLQRQVDQLGGYIRLTATRPIFAFEVFGSRDSHTFLASVPAQGESLKPQISGRMVDASQGANVISSDGSTSLLIPPKALKSNAAIEVAPISTIGLPLPAPGQQPIAVVEATPAGTQFQIPVRLTFPVNADLDPGTKIPLLIFDPQSRTYQQTEFVATVDKSGRTASAEVTHFTQYVASLAGSLLTISDITPSTASPGDTITITGNGFCTARPQTSVTFVGASNTSIQGTVLSVSAASIQARVPAGAITGQVVVRSCKQTSTGYVIKVSSPNPAPGTISISPSSVTTGTSSVTLQIAGTNFLANSVVNYDGAPIADTFVDPTLLKVTLGSMSTAGIHHINVVNPAPGGGTSNTADLTVARNTVATNQAPTVNAGPNQTITLPASANLKGTATDDGLPNGTLITTWSKVSGPGTVTFVSANALTTTASFSTAGSYVLRLTANDGALSSSADVTITVNSAVSLSSASLALAYSFSEGNGATSVDSSGNGNTLSLLQTAWATGKYGSALLFDGTSSYASANSTSSLDLNGPGTIEAWVQPSVLGRWESVLAKGSSNVDSVQNYGMELTSSNQVFCVVGNGTSANVLTSVGTVSSTTQFTHLACTWDGATIQLYINGVLDALATQTLIPAASASPLYIGQYGGSDLFSGVIDEVRIYNRALAQAEIQSDMATPIGSVTSTNHAPTVNAGPDQTITLPASANLNGTAIDDGLPTGSTLVTTWSKFSGPGTVTFGNASAKSTTATFSASGTYVLRLTASDSALTATDDVSIVVNSAVSSSSSGNTYYVSNSGSDSNSGTSQSSPWKTISKVQSFLGSLRPGDSVLFQRGGIWYEALDLSNVNGTASARITFSNYGTGNLPIIDGGGSKSGNSINGGRKWCMGVEGSKISYVTIDGLECRYASNYGIAFLSLLAGSYGVIVQNSYIHDTGDGDYGYHNQLMWGDYRSNADGTKFLNNKVGNCYGHNCIEIQGDLGGPVVQGNECYGWAHTCIDLEYDQGAVVDSNVVHDSLGIQPTPVAFYLESGTNGGASSATNSITWTHNVVYGSGIYTAFQCQYNGTPIICNMYDNVIQTTGDGTYAGAGSSVQFYIKNNIFDVSGSVHSGGTYTEWDYNDIVQSTAIGSHDLHVNPLFVNAAGHDFHLQSSSPVINKGTNVGLPFNGTAPDMGAFEY